MVGSTSPSRAGVKTLERPHTLQAPHKCLNKKTRLGGQIKKNERGEGKREGKLRKGDRRGKRIIFSLLTLNRFLLLVNFWSV